MGSKPQFKISELKVGETSGTADSEMGQVAPPPKKIDEMHWPVHEEGPSLEKMRACCLSDAIVMSAPPPRKNR